MIEDCEEFVQDCLKIIDMYIKSFNVRSVIEATRILLDQNISFRPIYQLALKFLFLCMISIHLQKHIEKRLKMILVNVSNAL